VKSVMATFKCLSARNLQRSFWQVTSAASSVRPSWNRQAIGRPESAAKGLVAETASYFGRLYFRGKYVSPAGMLREIGNEATRIATHISKQPVRGRSVTVSALRSGRPRRLWVSSGILDLVLK
jgi:hypothetical protein